MNFLLAQAVFYLGPFQVGHVRFDAPVVARQKVLRRAVLAVGNGDIDTPETALLRLKDSGCAMVMIGRGALGKPWIFRQVNELMNAGSYTHPNHREIGQMILRHLAMMVELYGQTAGIRKMRAHFAYYTRGVKSGSRLREELNKTLELEGVRKLIEDYFEVEG
jgi:tRNA-dihydrouridine synthase